MVLKWIDCDGQHRINSDIVLPMRNLLRQLTDDREATDRFSIEILFAMVVREKAHIATLWTDDGRTLVGMGTIVVRQNMLRKTAVIDDVIVDEELRGKGFGQLITKALIGRARDLGASYIDLTSRSRRTLALSMYRALGFSKPDTNFLRLYLR